MQTVRKALTHLERNNEQDFFTSLLHPWVFLSLPVFKGKVDALEWNIDNLCAVPIAKERSMERAAESHGAKGAGGGGGWRSIKCIQNPETGIYMHVIFSSTLPESLHANVLIGINAENSPPPPPPLLSPWCFGGQKSFACTHAALFTPFLMPTTIPHSSTHPHPSSCMRWWCSVGNYIVWGLRKCLLYVFLFPALSCVLFTLFAYHWNCPNFHHMWTHEKSSGQQEWIVSYSWCCMWT